MKKRLTVALVSMILVASVTAMSFAQAPAAPPQPQKPPSLASELAGFTSSLSSFFGNAIQMMTQAIGYLTGGVQAAHLYQTGTNIINGMLTNGPKPPSIPLPQVTMPGDKPPAPPAASGAQHAPAPDALPALPSASGSAPATSGEKPDVVASVAPEYMSDQDFSDMLKGYSSLAVEEKKLLNQMKENPEDQALKEMYSQVQTTKLEKSTKIMASLNYDIEKKQFSKLNLLIEYINTSGPQTVKVFAQIVDSARGKLQFCLIEAKKFGLNMDIQIIEGKLKLVMSLTTGNFTPTAPPPSEPMGQSAPAAAPAAAPASTPTEGLSGAPAADPKPPAASEVKPATKKSAAKKPATPKKRAATEKKTKPAETK